MIFIRVAWQNMLVHRRRTLLILFSISLSVAVILFVSGMAEGLKKNFFRGMLEESGHLQILPAGTDDALDPYDPDLLIQNPDEIVSDLSARKGVQRAEKVLSFGCMLLAGDRNLTIEGRGTNKETRIFSKARDGIYAGGFLADDNGGKPGICISAGIADLLHVDLGDPLVVLVEDSTGSPWYIEYSVTGLYATDSREFDEGSFYLRHEDAEELLYFPGKTREIRVVLLDPALAGPLADQLDTGAAPYRGTEIKTWREIHGSYLVLLDFFDIFMVFMNIFTVLVAATVITNSILMNIFERTREYGTLRAIGMKRYQLFGFILTEGFVQGVAGSLLGLVLGIPLVLYFQAYGMNWGEITESFGLGETFYFAFAPEHAIAGLISGIAIACTGSLYAGWVSSRMSIMESL
ncbi:hypothetical protein B4O97_09700 [Marispirochaeta aestuarii]|uniref:ABC3 transporter permease protein domain-containing protein n=1 Tax=Marispirochaeta aestuarii TaxID=1963862 RepID=A0A1Y1RZH6_9SPIO|nr:FtsX-like permease family protein [Marispirochaeta aestuarii]ORC35434.1 hypothetical protein B4O97_09700 [Marispirochaeta aestuarii]